MSQPRLTTLAKAFKLLQRRLGVRSVPAHPLADDKKLQRVIDGLPYNDSRQTLEEVNHWLASLGDMQGDAPHDAQGFSVLRRYATTSALDSATRRSQARMLETLLASRGENFAEEKRNWKTLTAFWTLLANAYLSCALLCAKAEVSRAMKKELVVLAARGLCALRYQMKCVLLRYGVVDAALWMACGDFVLLAESVNGADTRVALYEGSAIESSPNDEFARLVMFWTLAPSGLSPAEQDIAERLVVHLTDKYRLSAFHEDGFDYFFDLAGVHPPLPLVRSSPWSAQTRYFQVSQARQSVMALHALMSGNGDLPPGLDLGAAAEPNVVARMLTHLQINWAKEMPARAAERRKADMALHVVQGYPVVLGLVAPASADGASPQYRLLNESWVTQDVSAGGYGVIVPAGVGEWLQVGDLIAVRAAPEVPWHLGIIRRVQAHKHNQRQIGIQLISKTAKPVEVRSLSGVARGGKRVSALMLDEWPLADGSIDLLVRRDLLSGREAVEVTYGADNASFILAPGGVVECGGDFDWLRYKVPAGLPTQ